MHGIDIGNMKEILLKVLKNFIVPGVTIYATVNQLMKMIKQNKLEDKLEKAIQEYRNNNNKQNSNNNNQESAADILYKDSKIKEEKEKKESEYKSKLLNILGDKATSADVLYAKPEQLEEKIIELRLEDKLKNLKNNVNTKIQQNKAELGIGIMYDTLGYNYASNHYGPDVVGMLDLAHGKRNEPSYTKDAIELKNFDDPRVASDKKYLVEKLYSQFQNEYTKVTNIENIKGYFFKSNSEPSQRISNNDDFRKIIKQNKNKILNGQLVTMEFPNYGLNNKKSNLHYAFGHVDIRNGYIDNKGNLHIKIYDTYDFNKKNKTALNQAGRNQMLKGNLKPFFTIHDIIVPKKDINELWK